VVAVAGAVTGLALFPVGRVTLLSGSTVPLAEALLRTLLIALYVGVSMLELVGEGGDQATACGVDWLRSGSLDQMAPGCC
jgi:hypothetical protein